MFGIEFLDANLTEPYMNWNAFDMPDPTNLVLTFYLAVVIEEAAENSQLHNDPEIVYPVHGGMALILDCYFTTFNINYTFFNGSVVDYMAEIASSTIAWDFNSPLGDEGTLTALSQGVDLALGEPSSAALARTWAKSYSSVAVAILASVYEARPTLVESLVQDVVVTKILLAQVWAIVALNVLFATIGLILGISALRVDSFSVPAVQKGLGVEGLVACLFETDRTGEEWLKAGMLGRAMTRRVIILGIDWP